MKIIANNDVGIMYRVSTKGQVVNNDIPLQQIECREFAKNFGWNIVEEYYERGVSGFKKKSSERDVVQQVKQDVLGGKFKKLLLFMADRLGRLEEDTLDLAKWFLSHGVEIWTVRDGQIRNDNLGDKIMNLIRFSAAQEESEKTSYRVSNRRKQLIREGTYAGGVVPYGYKKVRRGRLDKKGRELFDLEVDEAEKYIIIEIFDLYVHSGWGTGRIATYLTEKGIRTHRGSKFQANAINRILSNHLVIGHFKDKEIMSVHLPDLQIIDKELFERAKAIRSSRANARGEITRAVMQTKSKVLLSGNIFCSQCGSRMKSFKSHEKKRLADGTIKSYGYVTYYHCSNKTRRLGCEGQGVYIALKIDKAINSLLCEMFSVIKNQPQESVISRKIKDRIAFLNKQCQLAENEYNKNKQSLERLNMEIAASLVGNSIFSPENLQLAIETHMEKMIESENKLSKMQEELRDSKQTHDSLAPIYNELINWANEYDAMSIEEKKMIVNQLISRVTVGSGYALDVEFNMTYYQFCKNWGVEQQNLLTA